MKKILDNGMYYKGNLHSHSTISDGKMSIDEMVKSYQEKGYNFLMISDHNINTSFREFDNESFITIDGFEGNVISIDTRPFCKKNSPGGRDPYQGNVESYLKIGDAMGEAMLKLMNKEAK